MDKRLQKLRTDVDRIDNRLLAALNERAKVVQRIGKVKAERGEEVIAANRERQVLERLATANSGPLSNDALEEIFSTVMNNCRLLQKPLSIAYFGPEATFTHQAALKHFGKSAQYAPAKSISDVFDDVEKGRADYGVVPIENSTEGMVNHTLDMFMESDLVISAERQDPINQCLLVGPSTKKIKSVYSHPQALAQCRRWLESHLPGVPIHEAASTSDAAAQAAIQDGVGAIASPLAAALYRLRVLAPSIQDARNNRTRFLVLGKKIASPSGGGRDKTSILLSLKDRVGALHDLLATFKAEEINLTKIESRPSKRKAWEYVFFIDFLGHVADPAVQSVMKRLKEQTLFLKLLGSYPRGE